MMNMNIGNKIRELRKKKGITQEQLASALGISPQAVSKWEMSAGYPDIAMLPVIAGYFGVSMDMLFNYDAEKLEEKIKEIIRSVSGRAFEQAEKILLDGIAAYPGSDELKRELLELYAYRILNDGRPDLKEKALAIGEKLAAESNDYFIVSGAKNDMAMIHSKFGEYDEAKKIIESLPYVYHLNIYDRMRCSAAWLKGEDKLKATRSWKVWAHQELIMVCENEGMSFYEMGDYENAILSFEEAVNVNEQFLHRELPNEYTLLKHQISQGDTTVRIAACYYKLGKLDECDAALDKAYHLIRDQCSEEFWNTHRTVELYRRPYHEMGLDEYKPCI